jgi:hypothetical protein
MRGARIAGIVLIAAVAGFVAAQWLWPREGSAPPIPAAAREAASAPDLPLVSPAAGELRIAAGGRIAIEAAALEPGKPVVLLLDLGAPSSSDEPRPVRIASEDGRTFDAQGGVEGERTDARVEIDPAFLSKPGLYLVQVTTTEQSPFPLRRYVIQVR